MQYLRNYLQVSFCEVPLQSHWSWKIYFYMWYYKFSTVIDWYMFALRDIHLQILQQRYA